MRLFQLYIELVEVAKYSVEVGPPKALEVLEFVCCDWLRSSK